MKQKFEKIEKHLYRREYQTASGDWSTLYYGNFVDWKHVRRNFCLGDNLDAARDELGRLRNLNRGRYDFDAEKKEREQAKVRAMTVNEWLDRYLSLIKGKASYKTKRSECGHLKQLLGHLPPSEVSRVRVLEYKQRRLSEPLIRHGKAVAGTKVKGSSVNREVSCLVTALNLAADEGLCDTAPRIRKEREQPRERILTPKEFQTLLDASPRWLQRCLIAADQTGINRGGIIRLTWDSINDGLITIRRQKTGAKQIVGISPSLAEVLQELREEYHRTPNLERCVFVTKKRKPISETALRHAFDRAIAKAKIENFQLRDFRHAARTRWASLGLPFEIAEMGLGHKLHGISGKYINLSDDPCAGSVPKNVYSVFQPSIGSHRNIISFHLLRACGHPFQ